jgi:hypothetical protein
MTANVMTLRMSSWHWHQSQQVVSWTLFDQILLWRVQNLDRIIAISAEAMRNVFRPSTLVPDHDPGRRVMTRQRTYFLRCP